MGPSKARWTGGIDWDASASDIVHDFHTLAGRAPRRASALVDRVAATAEQCWIARTEFCGALGTLIVALPPEGARYPARVLADLVEDEAIDIRAAAVSTVADLVAHLRQRHLQQMGMLMRAVWRRFQEGDHWMVRQEAGVVCLLFGFTVGDLGLPYLAVVARFLTATLSPSAVRWVFGQVSDLQPAFAPASTSATVPG